MSSTKAEKKIKNKQILNCELGNIVIQMKGELFSEKKKKQNNL